MDARIIAEQLIDECQDTFPAIAKTADVEIDSALNGYIMSLDEGMQFDGASAYQIAVVVLPVIAAAAKLKEIRVHIRKSKSSVDGELVIKFYGYDKNAKQLQQLDIDDVDGSGNGDDDGSGNTC